MDAADENPGMAHETSLIRVDDLWFYDHGLVLQAGNRLFRVSGATLAARSSVFRDMVSIPQPENQPLIDGCPVVLLHDSPTDAEYLLRAIFDSGFFERPPAPTTFKIVSGILKLSRKYDVEYLRRRALLHLSAALPRSLAEFDSCNPLFPFGSRESVFSLLLLVHNLGLTWALPMVLYYASCFDVEDITDGVVFDGTRVHLPAALQRLGLVGRSKLTMIQNHDSYRFLRYLPCEGCLSRDECRDRVRLFLDRVTGLLIVDPLSLFNDGSWASFHLICTACSLAAQPEHKATRQRVWDELPAVFGLESWETLEKARSADIDQ
ncbi:hypothetical protein DFH06DRAFT_256446 [Mycena polygramma]|nr:hypothetical protein DFH06DRAFT_256446 [Mycena polygramma]